jgi:aspartate aminotransferase
MISAFEERHDFIVYALNAIDGIQCPKSQGAFYSFQVGMISKVTSFAELLIV